MVYQRRNGKKYPTKKSRREHKYDKINIFKESKETRQKTSQRFEGSFSLRIRSGGSFLAFCNARRILWEGFKEENCQEGKNGLIQNFKFACVLQTAYKLPTNCLQLQTVKKRHVARYYNIIQPHVNGRVLLYRLSRVPKTCSGGGVNYGPYNLWAIIALRA